MIKATCIQKFRDPKTEKILGYKLKDSKGMTLDIEANKLKREILNGTIEIDNLTLTSDKRLVSTSLPSNLVKLDHVNIYKEGNKLDIEELRKFNKNKDIFKRYQGIFDVLGIDVLAGIYLKVPLNENVSMEEILRESLPNTKLSNNIKIDDLIKNPSNLLGSFIDYNSGDKKEYETESPVSAYACARIPLLLLHKDGKMKLVVAAEYERSTFVPTLVMSFTSLMQDSGKINQNKLSILTVDNNKDTHLIHVGRYLSDREKVKLGRYIMNSGLENWLNTESVKKMVSKTSNMEAKVKLANISTLPVGIPAIIMAGFVIAPIALAAGYVKDKIDEAKGED